MRYRNFPTGCEDWFNYQQAAANEDRERQRTEMEYRFADQGEVWTRIVEQEEDA